MKIVSVLVLFCGTAWSQTGAGSCSEFFDSPTAAGSANNWTIGTTGSTVRWWNPGEIPALLINTNAGSGAGHAYIPCGIGNGNFTLQADVYIQVRFKNAASGVAVGLTTAPPGSMGAADSSISMAALNQGISAGLRTGEIQNLGGKSVSPAMSFPWPQVSDSAINPFWRWTFQIVRSGNVLTWNVFTDQYQNGSVPYFTQSYTMTSHTADNYQYLSIVSVGGSTQTPYAAICQVTNVRAWAGAPAAAPTIAGIVPSGGATTFQSGNQITINGTNFDSSSWYVLRVGQAGSLQTATPAYVDPMTLTVTLPPEPNGATYSFHLLRNGVDAEYYPGIYYSAPVVTSIVPFEVPTTPASNDDGTVQIYGSGFDPTSTVTLDGNAATVTYINPTQLTVVVPAGNQGSPHLVVTSAGGGITVYDSAVNATYPRSGRINFGYASHPYMQFTAAGTGTSVPTVAQIQARWTDPNYAPYVADVISELGDLFTYGYNAILNGSPSDYGTYQAMLASESLGTGLPAGELNRLQFYNQQAGFSEFLGNNATHIAEFYDAFFPSMTPATRAQYLAYLSHALSYYEFTRVSDSSSTGTGTGPGASWPNRVAIANGGAGNCALAVANSLQSLPGFGVYAIPQNPRYIAATGLTEATVAVKQLRSWANYSWMPDGVYVEGSQYAGYGGTPYLIFAHSLQNMVALGVPGFTSDQGILATNYQNYANWVNSLWDGVTWATYNDTQVEDVDRDLLIDAGMRYGNGNLLYLADYLTNAVNNRSGPYGVYTTHVSGNYIYGGAYNILWRTPDSFGNVFTGFPAVQVNPSAQQAALRSDTTAGTPFYIGIKGQNNHETSSSQHNQCDHGSFVVQSRGEEFIIDPGYYRPNCSTHSIPAVDTFYPGHSTASVTSFDMSLGTGGAYNNGGFRAVAIDATAAYAAANANLTRLRRTFVMYSSGPAQIAFILDDIATNGPGAITTLFQSGKPVTVNGTTGFTLTGNASNLLVSLSGPAISSITNFDTTSPGNRGTYSMASYSYPSSYPGGATSDPSWMYALLSGTASGGFNGRVLYVYSPGTTYGLEDTVSYNGLVYRSVVAGNTGTAPDSDPTKWMSLGGSSVFYNQVTAKYNSSSGTPLLITLAPSGSDGSGALTASVDWSAVAAGIVNIAISDGAALQFVQQGGVWKLNSTSSLLPLPVF